MAAISLPSTDIFPATGSKSGSVTLILGCMFSGKTTEFIGRLRTFPSALVRVFKHVIDDRYRVDAVVTHTGSAVPAVRVSGGRELLDATADGPLVVAVDEAHFFDLTLDEAVGHLASKGIDVLLTALDVDSWSRPFPLIERLRHRANEVVMLTATCARCHGVADRTQRLTPIEDGVMVGGPECYEPRCRNCWVPPPQKNRLGVDVLATAAGLDSEFPRIPRETPR